MVKKAKDERSLEIKVSLASLEAYERLPYSLESMLGELIDNSYQAYEENKKALNKKGVKKVIVDITYDSSAGKLIVKDNSSGMTFDDVERAFDVGRTRERSDQSLGEFNIGLKAAAIWLCGSWEIKTKHLDEDRELNVLIDNDAIIKTQRGALTHNWNEVAQSGRSSTKFIFEELKYEFPDQQITKAIQFLASMYRMLLGNTLEINVTTSNQGTRQVLWEPFQLHTTDKGKELKYTFDGTINESDPRRVSGWIGILKTGDGKTSRGATGKNSGISIFRRRRGMPNQVTPRAWKGSQSLFAGGVSNLAVQRIVGEVNFDEGRVSHMKDSIVDSDLVLLDLIFKGLNEEHQIKQTASKLRDKQPEDPSEKKDKLKSVLQILNSSDLNTLLQSDIPPLEAIEEKNDLVWESLDLQDEDKLDFKVKAFLFNVWVKDLSDTDPFIIYKKTDQYTMKAVINSAHDFITTNNFIGTDSYTYFLIVLLATRFKMDNDNKSSMDEFFEVLDMIMRLKIEATID